MEVFCRISPNWEFAICWRKDWKYIGFVQFDGFGKYIGFNIQRRATK